MHYVKLIKYHIYGITATVSSQHLHKGYYVPLCKRNAIQYKGGDVKMQWHLLCKSHFRYVYLKTEGFAL